MVLRSVSTLEVPRIFISYAHRDGAELAIRLQGDLEGCGLEVWLDRKRLFGGDGWSKEIEIAIDRCCITLALLSAGSYQSDICRAEQERSRARHKLIVPLLVQRDCDVPLTLQTKLYIDFSDPANYATAFQQLRRSILERPTVEASVEERVPYSNAPALPDNFIDRPEVLTALREALFEDVPNRNIALTALHGMGGIGKTVLAQALCHDEVVQHAYPDGIYWFTIGREAPLSLDQRVESAPGLKQLLGQYSSEGGCISQYRTVLQGRAVLIVLDDVWRASDIEPFRAESPRSRILITTRNAAIAPCFGTREFTAELLSEREARQVLAQWAGRKLDDLPSQANDIIRECQNLPLALAMVGALLKGRPAAYWNVALEHLLKGELTKFKVGFSEPHTTLFRAMQVSVDALRSVDPIAEYRYRSLAILLEGLPIAGAVQQALWNVGEIEALETAELFVSLSLARREGRDGSIRLHDLQLDYIRSQYEDVSTLSCLREAVRLSVHVFNRDPNQFASQLIGRLGGQEGAIGHFIERLASGAPRPYLRPRKPTLHPPGTALMRTLTTHSGAVDALSVTPDGKIAIFAQGTTLHVWEMEAGREVCKLTGHSGPISGVRITRDGRSAVSASIDGTLIIWDIAHGLPIRQLAAHEKPITCIDLSPNEKLVVSGSADHTVKIWELSSGRNLSTLIGHSDVVADVAFTPDGRKVLSAGRDDTLRVWDIEAGCEKRTIQCRYKLDIAIAVSPSGEYVVSAPHDGTVKVWEIDSGTEVLSLHGHPWPVRCLTFAPDGQSLVIGGYSGAIALSEFPSGPVRRLYGHSQGITGLAVRSDGRSAVSSSWDGTVKIWNLDDHGGANEAPPLPTFGWVQTLDVSVNAGFIATGGEYLLLRELETFRPIHLLAGHTEAVYGVALTLDGKRLLSCSWDGTLRIWATESGSSLAVLTGRRTADTFMNAVAVNNTETLAITATDHTLRVWDLIGGRSSSRTLRAHTDTVWSVAVTADGRRAISASHDMTLKVWDLTRWQTIRTLRGHLGSVRAVAMTRDGRFAASASDDETVRIWKLGNGREMWNLVGHTESVRGIAISPCDRFVASCSHDHTVRVWNMRTGTHIATFTCDSILSCCRFVTSTRILASDVAGVIHDLIIDLPGRS